MPRILHVFLLTFGLTLFFFAGISAFAVERATPQTAPTVRYVTTDGSDPDNNCTNSSTACATIQHAVDVAAPGDEVWIAGGRYTGVNVRAELTQTVYISKSLALRGGYTTTWAEADPKTNPTILDAQGLGRVMTIRGPISVTVEGLGITGGDAWGLGGGKGTQLVRIDRGGGLFVLTATLTLRNSRIYSNTAYEGGGLSLQDSQNSILKGNDVFSNTALGETGGILLETSQNVSVSSNLIQYNRLQRLPPPGWEEGLPIVFECGAGGMFVTASKDVVVDDTTIDDNEGIGLCLAGGIAVVTHSTISNNKGRGISSSFGQAVIRYSIVSGNGKTGNGGGIGGIQTEIVIEGNRIINNRAGVGGGLYFSSSNVTVSRNWIAHNQAHLGGGIYLWLFNPSQKVTVVNTVIADNESDGPGDALYVDNAHVEIAHSTIARNRGADGSGVYLKAFGAVISMTNTILVDHQVGISGTQGSSAFLNGVLWDSTNANVLGPVALTAANLYTGTSGFACDGYHLTADSIAIDRGVTTDITVDIDGDARPQGKAPDLGADEFVADTSISCIQSYLPLIVR